MRVAILLLAGCALAQGKQLVKSKDFGIHIWTPNSPKCHLLHRGIKKSFVHTRLSTAMHDWSLYSKGLGNNVQGI